MLKVVSQYWPLLAIPPAACAVDLGLVALHEAWSANEWASNIIFAYAVTLATVALARRQEKLQESLAATEIFEKIAAVTGNLDSLRTDLQASSVRRLLLDARAGLQLLPYADAKSRGEYMTTLCHAASTLSELISGSVRAYTLWPDEDWERVCDCVVRLLSSLEFQVAEPDKNLEEFKILTENLREIPKARPVRKVIPFSAFRKSFEKGDVAQRIRARLSWDRLQGYVDRGVARVEIRRWWSADWVEQNEIFSVWYARNDRRGDNFACARYVDPDVHPIKHNDINDYFDALPLDVQTFVNSMIQFMRARPNGLLPTVEIVTIDLDDNKVLVLDGNHRTAAIMRGAYRSRYPLLVNVVEYRIIAPKDAGLVPDLKYYYNLDVEGSRTGAT